MNTLTSSTNQTPIEVLLRVSDDGTVSAKSVYEFLELDLRNYARWCKTNITENEFAEENADFSTFVIQEERNPNPTTDYKLKVSFAKKLCMLSKTERGEQARNYFIKVEQKLNQLAIDTSQLSPQMQLLTQMVNVMATQEVKINQLEAKVQDAEQQTVNLRQRVNTVQDTIIQRNANWRMALNRMFNNAVQSMADCIIRILDWCGKENIDIEEIIKIKHNYNKKRPYKHGGKKI